MNVNKVNKSKGDSKPKRSSSAAMKNSPVKMKKRKLPMGVTTQGSNFSTTPMGVAYGHVISTPTWLHMEGKVSHPELGGGVRVAGRQLLCSVTTTAGDSKLLLANGATLATDNSILLSPDTLNGRLALQARTYDRYAFRKVKLTYVGRVSTSQSGSFALSYVSDPVIPSPSFALVTSMCPCIQASFYTPHAEVIVVDDMANPRTYFTLLDATSSASLRTTVQGTIVGFPDSASIGATTQGFIYIDYLIDLYQPTLDQGFTLRLTKEEIDMIVHNRETSSVSAVASTSVTRGKETEALELMARLKSLHA